MRFVRVTFVLLVAFFGIAQQAQTAQQAKPEQQVKSVGSRAGLLSATEMQQLMPPSVFFRGQTATTQMRNSFGIRFGNGGLMLAGLVDTGGYSTAVRERYQFYLLTDTSIEADGKKLAPGAYGCGFVMDGGFLVMDLAGNELLRTPTKRDAELSRPRPLQMRAGSGADEVRLYLGRDYVTLRPSR